MAGKWVREGTNSVYRYICKGINFANPTAKRKAVTLVANRVAPLHNQPLPEQRVDGVRAPAEGFGNTADIVVGNA
ncbi:hypothetical protein FOVG_18211 [Fusarium oxysporum f. sp. pisi HDV247]|nr:hypothetical protein FOVG_18211 [Fusarium oxysporum f. sp. pisi HDV247]